MILFTSRAVKVLLLLVVLFVGWWQFCRRASKRCLITLGILTVLFALIANFVSGFVPPMRDQVILTAQGEKCDAAKSSEVYLAGYTVDGNTFISGKSLCIKEGHWFWSGGTYAWRPETDSRQPDSVTRTVVIEIPVGWNRTLNFQGSIWRGKVEISNGARSWMIDTYAKNNSTISEEIGRSETSALILNQVRRLAVYSLLFFLFVFSAISIVRLYLCKQKDFFARLQKHETKLVCAGIAIVIFGLMFHYADRTSLWNDEMFQVAFSNGSLYEALDFCMTTREASPPLFDLFATLWYRVAPYGEKWLLLPSIVAAAGSIYIAGLIGEKIYGKYGGILSSLFCGSIPALWTGAAFEFRTYPFFVLFSFLTFYCYIRRNEHLSAKSIVIFGFSMAALAMNHYFGMIACACLFCSDVYLLSKRKTDKKVILSYFIPGAFSLFWLIAVCRTLIGYTGARASISWYGVPDLQELKALFQYLTGGHVITYALFFMGIGLTIARLFERTDTSFSWSDYYQKYAAINVAGLILGIFIYGNFTSSKTTLWSNRYFLVLFPYVCIVLVKAIHEIIFSYEKISCYMKKAVCYIAAMGLLLDCLIVVRNTTAEPWREAADWLYTQTNYIFNEDTVVLNTLGVECTEGWRDYYITKQGRRDALRVESIYAMTKDELRRVLQQNSRIYVAYPHGSVPTWLETMIAEEHKLLEKNQKNKVNTYVRK